MKMQILNPIEWKIRRERLKDYCFGIENGWTVLIKETKNGPQSKQLANLVAWPIKETLVEDGNDVSRTLVIKGLLSNRKWLPNIQLSLSDFNGNLKRSLSRLWGTDIIIKPGANEHLREAIQVLGGSRERETMGDTTSSRVKTVSAARRESSHFSGNNAVCNLFEKRPYLAEFMIMYLEWVETNWAKVPSIFQETYRRSKPFFDGENSGRINESLAKLCGGLEVVLTFAKEKGFIDEEQYYRYGQQACEAFQEVLINNVTSLTSEKPSQKFLVALSEITSTVQGSLCRAEGDVVPESDRKNLLVCYDEEFAYLFPQTCFRAVTELIRKQGQQFPVGDKTLWNHLKDEGIIECGSEVRGRNTVQKRLTCLDGKSVDVLKMKKSLLGL